MTWGYSGSTGDCREDEVVLVEPLAGEEKLCLLEWRREIGGRDLSSALKFGGEVKERLGLEVPFRSRFAFRSERNLTLKIP